MISTTCLSSELPACQLAWLACLAVIWQQRPADTSALVLLTPLHWSCSLDCSDEPAQVAAASSSSSSSVSAAPIAPAAGAASTAAGASGTAAAAAMPPRKPGSNLVSPREAAAKLKQLLPSGRGKSERSELLDSFTAAAAATGAGGSGGAASSSAGAAAPAGNSRWAAATRDQQASYQRSASEIKRAYGRPGTGRWVACVSDRVAGWLGWSWSGGWVVLALHAEAAALAFWQPNPAPTPLT